MQLFAKPHTKLLEHNWDRYLFHSCEKKLPVPFFYKLFFFVENLLFNAAFKCYWKTISLGALNTAFQKANHFFLHWLQSF